MCSDGHEHTNRCWWNPDEARWICRPGESTASPIATDQPLVDVRDMIVVHTAMLREFRLAPAAVTRTAAGDRKRAAAVTKHLRLIGDMLHHHHQGEDALLWPKLRARTPESARAVIEEAAAQHAHLDATLANVGRFRDAWRHEPDVDARDRLAAELNTLHTALSEHLDLEERALLPLAASALSTDEWHAIGARAAAAMRKPDLVLAFGMFAYEGDPAVLRDMLASAPAPLRVLFPRVAPRVYARRARQIHRTARP